MILSFSSCCVRISEILENILHYFFSRSFALSGNSGWLFIQRQVLLTLDAVTVNASAANTLPYFLKNLINVFFIITPLYYSFILAYIKNFVFSIGTKYINNGYKKQHCFQCCKYITSIFSGYTKSLLLCIYHS